MRALALLFALAACSGPSDQPGGLTADDQRQLNEAAEMLEDNSVAPATVSNESERQ